jgi:hypothetical protein
MVLEIASLTWQWGSTALQEMTARDEGNLRVYLHLTYATTTYNLLS